MYVDNSYQPPLKTTGRLEDLPLPRLLQILAALRLSGKLSLSHRDGSGVVIFRAGRIIYAASNSARETLGHLLVTQKMISEKALKRALELQNEASQEKRLGTILLEIGALSNDELGQVLQRQVTRVLRELSGWRSGFFKFDRLEVTHVGEVSVDVHDYLMDEGIPVETVTGELVEESQGGVLASQVSPEVADTIPTLASLKSIMSEIRSPTFTAEISLQLMRYASQVTNRGVLFVRQQDVLRGMGQYGVELEGVSADARVREIQIPLDQPSVLADVVESGERFCGPLPDTPWNQHLADLLGGDWPQEIIALPMTVSGAVVLVLYGDNLPHGGPIDSVDSLEVLMLQAGLAMEKAMLETRLRQVDDRLGETGG